MNPHWPKVQQWQRDDSMQEQLGLLWSLVSGLLGNSAEGPKYESLLGSNLPVEEIVTSPKSLLADERPAPRPEEPVQIAPQTIDEQPLKIKDDEMYMANAGVNPQIEGLARIIISEAEGESLAGKQAVANVIMNRVKSKKYGFKGVDDILKTISRGHSSTKKGEFESYKNERYNNAPNSEKWNDAVRIATAAHAGRLRDITGGSLFFRNPDIRDAKRKSGQTWFDTKIAQGVLKPYNTIGGHQFYRQVK